MSASSIRRDRVDLDLAFAHAIAPAGLDVRTRPDPDAAGDLAAPDSFAKALRELHRGSLLALGPASLRPVRPPRLGSRPHDQSPGAAGFERHRMGGMGAGADAGFGLCAARRCGCIRPGASARREPRASGQHALRYVLRCGRWPQRLQTLVRGPVPHDRALAATGLRSRSAVTIRSKSMSWWTSRARCW